MAAVSSTRTESFCRENRPSGPLLRTYSAGLASHKLHVRTTTGWKRLLSDPIHDLLRRLLAPPSNTLLGHGQGLVLFENNLCREGVLISSGFALEVGTFAVRHFLRKRKDAVR